jgi:hypothetical protein
LLSVVAVQVSITSMLVLFILAFLVVVVAVQDRRHTQVVERVR